LKKFGFSNHIKALAIHSGGQKFGLREYGIGKGAFHVFEISRRGSRQGAKQR
jgi:hypothetical protein